MLSMNTPIGCKKLILGYVREIAPKYFETYICCTIIVELCLNCIIVTDDRADTCRTDKDICEENVNTWANQDKSDAPDARTFHKYGYRTINFQNQAATGVHKWVVKFDGSRPLHTCVGIRDVSYKWEPYRWFNVCTGKYISTGYGIALDRYTLNQVHPTSCFLQIQKTEQLVGIKIVIVLDMNEESLLIYDETCHIYMYDKVKKSEYTLAATLKRGMKLHLLSYEWKPSETKTWTQRYKEIKTTTHGVYIGRKDIRDT